MTCLQQQSHLLQANHPSQTSKWNANGSISFFIYYNWQDFECNHWRIFNLHSASVNHLRSWLCSFCRWDIPGTLNYIFLSTPRTFRKKNSTFFRERNSWKLTPGKFWLVPGKPARSHHIDCQGSSGLKLIVLCLKKEVCTPKNQKQPFELWYKKSHQIIIQMIWL